MKLAQIGVLVLLTFAAACSSNSARPSASTDSTRPGSRSAVVVVYIRGPRPQALIRTDLEGHAPSTIDIPDHASIDNVDVSARGLVAYSVAPHDSEEPDEIDVVDLQGHARLKIKPPTGSSLDCPKWSADDHQLLVTVTNTTTNAESYAVADASNGALTPIPIASPAPLLSCATWSSDGQAVVFAGGESQGNETRVDHVWRADVDGTGLTAIGALPVPCIINDLDADPHARLLAADVICGDDLAPSNNGIWTISEDTGSATRLTPAASSSTLRPPQYWNPRWLPDGSGIAYGVATVDAAGAPHAGGLMIVDLADRSTRRLTADSTINAAVALGP